MTAIRHDADHLARAEACDGEHGTCITPAEECPLCIRGERATYDEDDGPHCFECGGDGFVDAYDEDPINESPGTFVACGNCGGSGRAVDGVVW